MKCTNCGNENKNTNIRCEFCGTEFQHSIDRKDILRNKNYSKKNVREINLSRKQSNLVLTAILIVIICPWFLFGLALIGYSVSDHNKSKNYLETEGKLINYKNCEYDDGDELCYAVYEYTVNGITYEGSPNSLSNRSRFKKTMTVKYNPDSPSEYVINAGWNNPLIIGVIIVAVVSVIFISIKKFIKKLTSG